MTADAWQCFLDTFSYIGCAIDACWRLGTVDACSAYALLACFFCGRFSAVAKFRPCYRLFAHQNMQKPLYTDVIDQNIDNIYLCSWCRSTEVWLYSIIWGNSSVLESPVFCSYGEKFVAYWSDQLGWHGEICAATVATQQQLKGPGSLHTPLANNNFQGSMQRTRSF